MAYVITKRCNRCLKPMRNDGTEQNPIWVCNNPKCVKYVPPKEEPTEEKAEEEAATASDGDKQEETK